MIRNVNADGLGDRRGIAVERFKRDGVTWWRVYQDGAPVYTSRDEGRAREWANWLDDIRGE